MTKLFDKKNITVTVLLVFITAIAFAMSVFSVTYAVSTNWLEVDRDYAAYSSTDTLASQLSGAGTTVSITRTLGSQTADDNQLNEGNGVDTSYHYSSVDVLAYSAAPISGATVGGNAQTCSNYTVRSGLYCMVIKNVGLSSNSLDITLSSAATEVFVYPAAESNGESTISYANTYVDSFFTLQSVNKEKFSNPTNPIAINGAYRNIFILCDFTVDKDFKINTPSSVHLMKSNITLNKTLALSHNYAGIYVIDAAGGSIVHGVNGDSELGELEITARYATYVIADGAAPADTIFAYKTMTSETAVTYVTGILQDAEDYVMSYIPDRLYENISLPSCYGVSGVTYDYSVESEYMTADGIITRTSDSHQAVLSITATYGGMYKNIVPSGSTLSSEFEKTVTIVGTSGISLATELSEMIEDEITADCTLTDEKLDMLYDVDLNGVLTDFAKINNATLTLTISDSTNSCFKISFNGSDYKTNELTISSTNTIGFVSGGETLSATLDNANFYISPNYCLVDGDAVTIRVAVSNVSYAEKAFTVNGMAFAELCDYLETFIYEPTLSSSGTTDIITLYDNALYRGTERVSGSLSVTAIESKAFAVTEEFISAITADAQTYCAEHYDEWSNADGFSIVPVSLSESTLTGGILTATTVASGTKYMIVQHFTIAESDYYAYREITVPASGIGEGAASQYMSGNTFQSFYNDLDNGKLISSDYRFGIDTTGVKIFAVIESTDGSDVSNYCNVVYFSSGSPVVADKTDADSYLANSYEIEVDIENLPSRNHSARIIVYFYYSTNYEDFFDYMNGDDTKNDSYFTIQTYSFTLPGILKCGTGLDFNSVELYDFVLNAKDSEGNFVYDSYHHGLTEEDTLSYAGGNYLYADGAGVQVEYLDCSSLVTSGGIDISGIQLLTGTKGFSFSGVEISSVAGAFAAVNSNIISLDLSGCNLTNSIIAEYLSNNTALKYINLSYNNLTSLDGILYRTLTTLDISYQNAASGNYLDDIDGISDLPLLSYVNLAGNRINYFGELTELSALKTAVVSNNTPISSVTTGGNNAFGTLGSVNLPIYVQLINVQNADVITANDYSVTYSYRLDLSVCHSFFDTYSTSSGLTSYRTVVTDGSPLSIVYSKLTRTLSGVTNLVEITSGDSDYTVFTSNKTAVTTHDSNYFDSAVNTEFTVGTDISYIAQEACMILTGVEYGQELVLAEITAFSKTVKWGGSGTEYVVSYVSGVNSSQAAISDYSTLANAEKFGIIVSTTYDGSTMYALYSVTYRTV